MFNSIRPLQVDPTYNGHCLWLVAVCVSDFCDLYGTDRANEYFAAGQAKLAEFLDGNKLTKPIPYVRKAIKRAILDHWQTDRQLAIPPSTRRDMVNRGETPPDHVRHSWHDVFDGGGIRAPFDEHEAFDPMEDPIKEKSRSSGGDLINIPYVGESERQWSAPECRFAAWSQIIETLEVVFSLCRDDLDRAIVECRLDGFASIDDSPVHVSDVARQLGIRKSEVSERLNRLERRYYKYVSRRLPTKKRTQRAIAL